MVQYQAEYVSEWEARRQSRGTEGVKIVDGYLGLQWRHIQRKKRGSTYRSLHA